MRSTRAACDLRRVVVRGHHRRAKGTSRGVKMTNCSSPQRSAYGDRLAALTAPVPLYLQGLGLEPCSPSVRAGPAGSRSAPEPAKARAFALSASLQRRQRGQNSRTSCGPRPLPPTRLRTCRCRLAKRLPSGSTQLPWNRRRSRGTGSSRTMKDDGS